MGRKWNVGVERFKTPTPDKLAINFIWGEHMWSACHEHVLEERRNSIANAQELRLSCTNPSMWWRQLWKEATFTTENWEFSRCQLHCHWWYHRLSLWQSAVPPVATKFASWALSVLSVWYRVCVKFNMFYQSNEKSPSHLKSWKFEKKTNFMAIFQVARTIQSQWYLMHR